MNCPFVSEDPKMLQKSQAKKRLTRWCTSTRVSWAHVATAMCDSGWKIKCEILGWSFNTITNGKTLCFLQEHWINLATYYTHDANNHNLNIETRVVCATSTRGSIKHLVRYFMFSGEVNWPVCTASDSRTGSSGLVSNQPPVSFQVGPEHVNSHFYLREPRIREFFQSWNRAAVYPTGVASQSPEFDNKLSFSTSEREFLFWQIDFSAQTSDLNAPLWMVPKNEECSVWGTGFRSLNHW